MFSPIKKLAKLDYKLLLKNGEEYHNEEVNRVFQKWNRKYGLNLKFDDDHAERNNENMIAQTIIKEISEIEPDQNKVISSLVCFYYKKPSERKKKLLWYVYGEWLYENLLDNLEPSYICHKCGIRTNVKPIHGKCFKCRQQELKEHGYKLLKCKDCGKDIKIKWNNRRTCRCEECQKKEDKLKYIKYNKKRVN